MKAILTIFLCFIWYFSYADIPQGYYDGTEGLNGEELRAVLHNIINNHTELSYNYLRDVMLPYSDEDPENEENVILIYTGWSRAKSDFGGMPNEWNREHVWASSHGGFGNSAPEGTDAHHIRPCDVQVNSRRGNLDFDNGGEHYILNGVPTYCYVTSVSWEPRNEVKGDVARMMLYMAVRYEGTNGELNLELVNYTNSAPNGEPYHGKLSTLLAWHHQDPVDEWEIRRNNRIYEHQHNRNPFIDHPDFVARIWEGASSEINSIPLISEFTIYPNPFNPTATIEFNTMQTGFVSVVIVNMKGQKVRTIYENQAVQNKTIQLLWNGIDDKNNFVSSGVYYCLIKSDNETQAKKMLLLK